MVASAATILGAILIIGTPQGHVDALDLKYLLNENDLTLDGRGVHFNPRVRVARCIPPLC